MNRWRYRWVDRAAELAATLLPAALLAGALISAVAARGLLPQVQWRLPVGEILPFGWSGPPAPTAHGGGVQLSTDRHCPLRRAIMVATHSSLADERRMPDGRTIRAHRGRGRAGSGTGHCGNDVDLALGPGATRTPVSVDAKAVSGHFDWS